MMTASRTRPTVALALALAAALTVSGCFTVGGWSERMSRTAQGPIASFEVAGDPWSGEVLLADSSDVTIMSSSDDVIVRVAWRSLSRFTVADLGIEDLDPGSTPEAATLEQIRRAARYPFGLTDEQLEELLRALGTDQIRRIGP